MPTTSGSRWHKRAHPARLVVDPIGLYIDVMTQISRAALLSIAVAVSLASAAHAQVAPIPYGGIGGLSGFNGIRDALGVTADDDFRKGFSFRSFSLPVNAFGSGVPYSRLGAFGSGGLAADGAQYAYSFKGLGDTPVTLFGGVNSLRTTPDVFTALVTPGFERSSTLATSVNAGIEFKPASNISLSLSGSFVHPSATSETDLRSQLISGHR